jgi:hypothetical protein
MNHEDFQLAAGADPLHLAEDAQRHRAECEECRRFHDEILSLEARLGPALKIPVPAAAPAPRVEVTPAVPPAVTAATVTPIAAVRPTARPRPRLWQYGLAASVAAMVATLLFFGYSQQSLAHAVAMHADGEPESFLTATPTDPAALTRVMTTAGVELLPGGPMVSYARNCPLRGHTVAHLVVQTDKGPVVVLVLTHEQVASRRTFTDHGYHGVLVPASQGALAVLGAGDQDVDAVVAAVSARIRYLP